MSSIAIANAAATTLPTVNFRSHGRGGHGGHKQSSEMESQSVSSIGSVGQMPVGAAQGLLGNMLQSLQQSVGAQATAGTAAPTPTAAATGTSAPGTSAGNSAAAAANPGVVQDLNGFMHSLFQVLRQEGAGGAAAATPSTGTASAAAGAGQYQGSLASSLQTLIQQVGSKGSTTPAISNLESSFNTLVQGLSGNSASTASTSAAGGTASTQSSTASLQNFLNNLLQNLQTHGLQAPNLSGSSVNAKA
jgi:hypothetical protein